MDGVKKHTIKISVAVELKAQESPHPDLAKVLAADLSKDARLTRALTQSVDEAIAARKVKNLGRSIAIEA